MLRHNVWLLEELDLEDGDDILLLVHIFPSGRFFRIVDDFRMKDEVQPYIPAPQFSIPDVHSAELYTS